MTQRKIIHPLVIRSAILFVAILIGGSVFLALFDHASISSAVPKLVTLACSAPVVTLLNEVWKTKKQSEEFVQKRKAEVDKQFDELRKEFREELDRTRENFRLLLSDRDATISRLKGEIKSATRFYKLSDNIQDLTQRLASMEERLKCDEKNTDN